jgi:photosystem II stability/assembly factor-like uncharacterized protein
MKKIVPFLLCLNLFCTLQAQTISDKWTPQAVGLLPNNHSIVSIFIVNKDVVWAVADSNISRPFPTDHLPKVLKTINGGVTWQLYTVPIAMGRAFLDIYAVDSLVAWASGNTFDNGLKFQLFKTIDGGKTWAPIGTGYAASLFIRFFDAQNGIIWNRHAIARTQNGGQTFTGGAAVTGFFSNEGYDLTSGNNSCAVIGDSIWAGTTISRMAFSPDKGVNWQFQDLRSVPNFGDSVIIFSTSFKDAQNGITLGWNQNTFTSYLARTSNGGTTWTNIASYPFTFGTNVEYVRGTLGSFIVSDYDGLTAYTKDFGQSWVKIDSLKGNAVRFLNAQTGWVGNSDTKLGAPAMYKWNGGNILSAIKVFEAEEIALKMSPNPTSRFLTVEYSADFKPTSLSIYDASGKTVLVEKNLDISSQTIDLQGFTNGFYLVQLKNTEGVIARKIVVER